MRLFVSYRRAEVGGHAGRLADSLAQRLGAKNVFLDVSAIDAGRDFTSSLRDALDRCEGAIAVIGPGWLTASTPEGTKRLFEPEDYVRLELATVLTRSVPVAPVLVGGATLPAAVDLPEDLRPLVQRQAIVLRDETWHQDVDNLIRSLRGEGTASAKPSRRLRGVAFGTVALALLAAILTTAWWQPWAGSSGGGGQPVADSCPDPTGPDWTMLPIGQDATTRERFDDGALVFTAQAANWRRIEPRRWELIVDVSMANRTTASVYHRSYRYKSIIVGEHESNQSCFQTEQPILSPDTVGDGRSGYVVSCPPSGKIEIVLNDSDRPHIRMTEASEPSRC